ncbi:MAG: peptidoglycan-binding protein [Actinobacteria bacterium]|nr:peptidoglycan-binding protein [Actinomycetota bacterium]
MLGKGDRGEDVKFVQRRLQLHGFDAGSPDGIFGAKTDAQVRAFQKANGLEVDGRVGPATRKALKKKAPAKAPAGQPASIA